MQELEQRQKEKLKEKEKEKKRRAKLRKKAEKDRAEEEARQRKVSEALDTFGFCVSASPCFHVCSPNGNISVSIQPLGVYAHQSLSLHFLRKKKTQRPRTDANEASQRQGTATRVARCW